MYLLIAITLIGLLYYLGKLLIAINQKHKVGDAVVELFFGPLILVIIGGCSILILTLCFSKEVVETKEINGTLKQFKSTDSTHEILGEDKFIVLKKEKTDLIKSDSYDYNFHLKVDTLRSSCGNWCFPINIYEYKLTIPKTYKSKRNDFEFIDFK